jgi:CheY-like chemotaxis protein
MFYKRTILVVDDEQDVQEVIGELFINYGDIVLYASNSKEAFDVLLNNFVDVVISDMIMPGGSGTDLISNIGTLPLDDRPILYLISGMTDLKEEKLKDVKVERFYTKPFSVENLVIDVHDDIFKYFAA